MVASGAQQRQHKRTETQTHTTQAQSVFLCFVVCEPFGIAHANERTFTN